MTITSDLPESSTVARKIPSQVLRPPLTVSAAPLSPYPSGIGKALSPLSLDVPYPIPHPSMIGSAPTRVQRLSSGFLATYPNKELTASKLTIVSAARNSPLATSELVELYVELGRSQTLSATVADNLPLDIDYPPITMPLNSNMPALTGAVTIEGGGGLDNV